MMWLMIGVGILVLGAVYLIVRFSNAADEVEAKLRESDDR